MKRACVMLADGFEEVEALTAVDYLRRAGIEVVMAGLAAPQVRGAHGITVACDALLAECGEDFDAVVVPGGVGGTKAIAADSRAISFIKRQSEAGRILAAICAAPATVLHGACGIIEGRRFTGHPDTESSIGPGAFAPGRVVVDGKLITSRSAGTAGEFAMAIVAALEGDNAAAALSEKLLLCHRT